MATPTITPEQLAMVAESAGYPCSMAADSHCLVIYATSKVTGSAVEIMFTLLGSYIHAQQVAGNPALPVKQLGTVDYPHKPASWVATLHRLAEPLTVA